MRFFDVNLWKFQAIYNFDGKLKDLGYESTMALSKRGRKKNFIMFMEGDKSDFQRTKYHLFLSLFYFMLRLHQMDNKL